jgi:hypothetical protein
MKKWDFSETIPEIGGGGIKENDGDEFDFDIFYVCYIVRSFLDVTMYHQHNYQKNSETNSNLKHFYKPEGFCEKEISFNKLLEQISLTIKNSIEPQA